MKLIKWIGYASFAIGILLVLLGSVSLVFQIHILPVRSMISYFHGANSFFLITIVLQLYLHFCKGKE